MEFIPKESKGPTGKIDLVIGTKGDNDVTTEFNCDTVSVTYTFDTALGEAKKQSIALAADKPRDDGSCLFSVAQPVAVLLSVAPVKKITRAASALLWLEK